MSSARHPYLFLDSSVVLAYVTGQQEKAVDKLTNDVVKHHLNCVLSDSVDSECEKKLRELTDFLGNILVDLVRKKILAQRAIHKRKADEPIDARDVLAVERAFFEMHLQKPILDLKTVEALVVSFFDSKINSEDPPSLTDALVQLSVLILKLTTDIKTKLDSAVRVRHDLATLCKITPNKADLVSLNAIGLHVEDAVHIASAKEAQRSGLCSKAVFVTIDYRSILIYQEAILNNLAIWCVNPLYAVYHARL